MIHGSVKKAADNLPPANGIRGTCHIRVVLAEQNEIFRLGLEKLFTPGEGIEVVGAADNLGGLLSLLRETEADVVLADEALLAEDPRSIRQVSESAKKAGVIVETTSLEQEQTLTWLRAGVRGVIPRGIGVRNLLKCVRTVASGDLWMDGQSSRWIINELRSSEARAPRPAAQKNLTERELAVVCLVNQGLKNRQIASRLGTSEQVIKNRTSGVPSRTAGTQSGPAPGARVPSQCAPAAAQD